MNKDIMIIIIKTLWFIVSPPLRKAQEGTRSIQLTSWLYHSSICLFNNLERIAKITPPMVSYSDQLSYHLSYAVLNLRHLTVLQQLWPIRPKSTLIVFWPNGKVPSSQTKKEANKGFAPRWLLFSNILQWNQLEGVSLLVLVVCRTNPPPGRVALRFLY